MAKPSLEVKRTLPWKTICTREQPRGRYTDAGSVRVQDWYYVHQSFFGWPLKSTESAFLTKHTSDELDIVGRMAGQLAMVTRRTSDTVEVQTHDDRRPVLLPRGLFPVAIAGSPGEIIPSEFQYFMVPAPSRPILVAL